MAFHLILHEPRRVDLSPLAPRQRVSLITSKACHKRSIVEIAGRVRFPYAVGLALDSLLLKQLVLSTGDALLPLSRQYLNKASMVYGSHPSDVDAEFDFDFSYDAFPTSHSSLIFHVVVGGLGFFLGLLVSSSVKTKSVWWKRGNRIFCPDSREELMSNGIELEYAENSVIVLFLSLPLRNGID